MTQRNLRVLGVDKDENLLVVEGSVPGPNGGYLVITKAKKPPQRAPRIWRLGHGGSVEGGQAGGEESLRAVVGLQSSVIGQSASASTEETYGNYRHS